MIWLIALRELRTRGTSRSYLLITAALFVAAIGMVVLLTRLSGGDDDPVEFTIGLEGEGLPLAEILGSPPEGFDPTVVTDGVSTEALETEEIDVVFDGSSLVWKGTPDRRLDTFLRSAISQAQVFGEAKDLGLSEQQLGQLLSAPEIEEIRLDGSDDNGDIDLAAAFIAAIATFLLLQMWGAFMMMGVIEEKASKIVEILLSHVSANQLLMGKVLGFGILAVTQMLIVAAGLLMALLLAVDIEVPGRVWALIPLFVVTFLFSFAFYSSAFAAVGSTVSRQEDATQAQLPAMLPLVVGYMIATIGIESPDSLIVTIASFVPFTSPIVLPVRTTLVDVPIWQIVLALAILAGSTFLMLRFAARIYRNSLLRTGGRVPFKKAWLGGDTDPSSA